MSKLIKTAGSFVSFPSGAASNKEKNSLEYGTLVAKAIEHEWFSKDGNSTRFYANKQRFHSLKLYAEGDQDIRRYKDEFSFNGDLSYLNLDFTPVPIVPKFVDIIVNAMRERDWSIKAEAIDQLSTVERKRFLDRLKGEMEKKQALQQVQEVTGVNVFENDVRKLPGSDEELQLFMDINYKQGAEKAIETAVDYEFKKNRFELIRDRLNYDLVTLGIAAAKHTFNPTEGIKIEYVDPANLVYSDSESKYFDDCYYFGEVKRININELQKAFPHLTQDQLDLIIKHSGSYYDYNNIPYNQQRGDNQTVDVLYFSYKTVNNEIYKMKDTPSGGLKAILKNEDFLPPKDKRTGFSRTHRANEVIYEGVKVIGVNILLKWDLAKNMMRPSNHSPKVIMPFICASPKQYKGKLYSLVRRIEKYADQAQLINLKIQQAIQRMTPSGVYLDADGLVEIDLGNGSSYNPQEALNMYFQTGSVIGRSMTDDAGFNNGRIPIQELPGSTGQQLQALILAFQFQLEQIRLVTGVNEARDGTQPDKDALVGTQQLAVENSNVSTRNIDEAGEYIIEGIAEGIALRVKDVIEYSPLKKDYITAIGRYNVEVLEDLSEVHHNEFGIFLDLGPNKEEKLALESNIQQALAQQSINLEDAIDVRRIKDVETANQLLKMRRKKKEAMDLFKQKQAIEQQNNGLAQVAERTEAAKQKNNDAKSLSEGKLEQLKASLELKKQAEDVKHKKSLMDHEFELGLRMLQAQEGAKSQMAREKNQSDMDREKLKADAGQKPFESKGNDSTRGINLGSFEPS